MLTTPEAGLAQTTSVPFSGFSHDSSLPVEITAEALDLDQATGVAVFSGGVVVGQGRLRLASDRLEVFYGTDGATSGQVREMRAEGAVTLTTGEEAAEAGRAVYTVADGIVTMEGDVLLTQGPNALAGDRLRIDLEAGTGRMEGRVRTIFQPQGGGQ